MTTFMSGLKFLFNSMLLSMLVALVACAPKPKKSETKINLVPSMAFTDINIGGGAIIYGKQNDGPGSWARIFRPGDPVVVDMAFGDWNFSIIAFSGPLPLGGIKECAILNNVNIANESEIIDAVISAGNCGAAGLRQIKFQKCTQTDFTSADPVTNCTESAGIQSYRLVAMSHRLGAITGDRLISTCIQSASFVSGGPFVPVGVTNINIMPFEMIAYTGPSCDPGTDILIPFPISLSRPGTPYIKSFQSGISQIIVLNNDDPGLDATAPVVTITGSDRVPGNGKDWINAAQANNFLIGGACENGLPVNFFLNGASLGIGTCSGGFWSQSFDFSGYGDTGYTSSYTFEAKQIDNGGNIGSATLVLNKDTTAPTPGGFLSYVPTRTPTNHVNVTNPNININKGTDGAGSGSITYSIREYLTGNCTGGINQTHTLTDPTAFKTLSLTNGSTYSFSVATTDFAGNQSSFSTCSPAISVDTTLPSAATLSGTVGLNSGTTITNNASPTLSWTVSVSVDVVAQRVEVYDGSCPGGTLVKQNIINDNTTAGIDLGSFGGPLSEGTYDARIVAIDQGGNETPSTCSNNTTVDTTLPTIATGISFSSPLTNLPTSLTVTFSPATDNIAFQDYTVRFYNDGTCSGSVRDTQTVSNGGPYTASATALAVDGSVDGTYKVRIESKDVAGNSNFSPCSSASAGFDTTPPAEATYNGTHWSSGSSTVDKALAIGTWTPSTSPDLNQQKLYIYENDGVCTGTQIKLETFSSATSDYVFHALRGATNYTYKITSLDNAGNESAGVCSSSILVNQPSYGFGGEYIDGIIVGTDLFALSKDRLDKFDITGDPMNPALTNSYRFIGNPSWSGGGIGKGSEALLRILHDSGYIYVVGKENITVLDTNLSHKKSFPTNMPGVVDAVIGAGAIHLLDSANVKQWDISGSPNLLAANSNSPISLATSSCVALDYDMANNYLYAACGITVRAYNAGTLGSLTPGSNYTFPFGSNLVDILIDNTNNVLYAGADETQGRIGVYSIDGADSLSFTNNDTNSKLNRFGNIINGGLQISYATQNPTNEGRVLNTSNGSGSFTLDDSVISNFNAFFNQVVATNTHFYALTSQGIFTGLVGNGLSQPDTTPYAEIKNAFDVDISGNLAAIATDTNTVQVVDITDIDNPMFHKKVTFGAASNIRSVLLAANTVVGLSGARLESWDFTTTPSQNWGFNLTNPGSSTTPALAFNNKASPTHIFVGGAAQSITTVNMTTGAEDNIISACSGVGNPTDFYMKEDTNHLFVSCGTTNTIEIYNASDPTNLTIIGSAFNIGNVASSIFYDNNMLFVATGANGVAIINVTTLASPSLETTYDEIPFGITKYTYVHNNILYVTSVSDGVHAFDVSTPSAPAVLGKFKVGGNSCRGIPHPGNRLILGCNSTGVQVLNLEDPLFIHQ